MARRGNILKSAAAPRDNRVPVHRVDRHPKPWSPPIQVNDNSAPADECATRGHAALPRCASSARRVKNGAEPQTRLDVGVRGPLCSLAIMRTLAREFAVSTTGVRPIHNSPWPDLLEMAGCH
jgi:hypothetical protein